MRGATGGFMTDMVQATAPTAARVSDTYRWAQLAVGVAAMVMIANYQYGWTFFVPDIQKKFGWAINAQATTLNGYYLGMIVAGIGAGGVYGTCVGNALKWFPDKRGLAAG